MSLSSVSYAPILTGHPPRVNVVLRYVLSLVCAGTAGVHAALVPEHFAEGAPIGTAFLMSAVASAAIALAVRRPHHDAWAPAAAAALLLGTAVAYALSRSVGIPLLLDGPESLDLVGALTTLAEIAAATCGVLLITRKDER